MCDSTFYLTFEIIYVISQLIYFFAFSVDIYLLTRPKDCVEITETALLEGDYRFIILLYPVLKESKSTMRTSFQAMTKLDYPKNRYRIISIPNSNDFETIQSLKDLQKEFDFLEIMEVPPTTDPSWNIVWDNWNQNEKAYWWHVGSHAKNPDLPPKKTRQLIYAFYHLAKEMEGKEDFLLNYIDADTCLPVDHFLAAAAGMRHYDVLQATNIAGNLNDSFVAGLCALDHLIWDGFKYTHLTANGKHPYWVLGKALFYKGSDLLTLGGFHPWIAIEDPEVGLRFWVNGKKLGVIEKPVIEEVPSTFAGAIVQRQRWICGFFQTLSEPLSRLGMTPYQKFLAWCNFIPCLSLWINIIAVPSSIWAFIGYLNGDDCLPLWVVVLSCFNIVCAIGMQTLFFYIAWTRTKLVLGTLRSRIWYMLRVNPITAMIWWAIWLIPIWIGFIMFLGEGGLVWIRTTKVNALEGLLKSKITHWFRKR